MFKHQEHYPENAKMTVATLQNFIADFDTPHLPHILRPRKRKKKPRYCPYSKSKVNPVPDVLNTPKIEIMNTTAETPYTLTELELACYTPNSPDLKAYETSISEFPPTPHTATPAATAAAAIFAAAAAAAEPRENQSYIFELEQHLTNINIAWILPENLSNRTKLASGNYGECFYVTYKNETFISKKFKKYRTLAEEVIALHAVQHVSHVQRLVGICWSTRELLTCYAGRTLEECQKHLMLCNSNLFSIVKQLVDVVHNLNQQGFAHNDIKPSNVCIDTNINGTYDVTLIDFGLSGALGKQVFRKGVYNASSAAMYSWISADVLCGEGSSTFSEAYSLRHLILGLRESDKNF